MPEATPSSIASWVGKNEDQCEGRDTGTVSTVIDGWPSGGWNARCMRETFWVIFDMGESTSVAGFMMSSDGGKDGTVELNPGEVTWYTCTEAATAIEDCSVVTTQHRDVKDYGMQLASGFSPVQGRRFALSYPGWNYDNNNPRIISEIAVYTGASMLSRAPSEAPTEGSKAPSKADAGEGEPCRVTKCDDPAFPVLDAYPDNSKHGNVCRSADWTAFVCPTHCDKEPFQAPYCYARSSAAFRAPTEAPTSWVDDSWKPTAMPTQSRIIRTSGLVPVLAVVLGVLFIFVCIVWQCCAWCAFLCCKRRAGVGVFDSSKSNKSAVVPEKLGKAKNGFGSVNSGEPDDADAGAGGPAKATGDARIKVVSQPERSMVDAAAGASQETSDQSINAAVRDVLAPRGPTRQDLLYGVGASATGDEAQDNDIVGASVAAVLNDMDTSSPATSTGKPGLKKRQSTSTPEEDFQEALKRLEQQASDIQEAQRVMAHFHKETAAADAQLAAAEVEASLRLPRKRLKKVLQRAVAGKSEDELHALFKRLDVTQDGTIDASELMIFCGELGKRMSKDVCKDMIRVMDLDYSGAIDWNEFKTFIGSMGESGKQKRRETILMENAAIERRKAGTVRRRDSVERMLADAANRVSQEEDVATAKELREAYEREISAADAQLEQRRAEGERNIQARLAKRKNQRAQKKRRQSCIVVQRNVRGRQARKTMRRRKKALLMRKELQQDRLSGAMAKTATKLRAKLRATTIRGGSDLRKSGPFVKIFKKYDKDKSGALSYDEFGAGVKKLVKLSDTELKTLLMYLDADCSAEIELQELVDFVTSDIATKEVARNPLKLKAVAKTADEQTSKATQARKERIAAREKEKQEQMRLQAELKALKEVEANKPEAGSAAAVAVAAAAATATAAAAAVAAAAAPAAAEPAQRPRTSKTDEFDLALMRLAQQKQNQDTGMSSEDAVAQLLGGGSPAADGHAAGATPTKHVHYVAGNTSRGRGQGGSRRGIRRKKKIFRPPPQKHGPGSRPNSRPTSAKDP